MVLNIIFISIIVISLAVIIFIYARKIPQARVLDVQSLPEEQTAQARDRILRERMRRHSKKGRQAIKKGAGPIFAGVKNFFSKIFKRIHELEKKYQKEASGKPLEQNELTSKLKTLIAEAEKLQKEEKLAEAEKKFIEVITLDPRNIKAYKKLAEIYLNRKELPQARETYFYVLKLEKKQSQIIGKKDQQGNPIQVVSNAHELADAHIDLGQVFQMMKKYDQAMQHYQSALELEPNNPRNLDQMLEIALITKNKEVATDMLVRLEQVNPENQKLSEYRSKVEEL